MMWESARSGRVIRAWPSRRRAWCGVARPAEVGCSAVRQTSRPLGSMSPPSVRRNSSMRECSPLVRATSPAASDNRGRSPYRPPGRSARLRSTGRHPDPARSASQLAESVSMIARARACQAHPARSTATRTRAASSLDRVDVAIVLPAHLDNHHPLRHPPECHPPGALMRKPPCYGRRLRARTVPRRRRQPAREDSPWPYSVPKTRPARIVELVNTARGHIACSVPRSPGDPASRASYGSKSSLRRDRSTAKASSRSSGRRARSSRSTAPTTPPGRGSS